MPFKIGIDRDAGLLRENSLNDEAYRAFLRGLGVTRCEYELCPGEIAIAPGAHSLHLPYYLTNTSHACPLAAAAKGIDPGLPYDEAKCEKHCLTKALLYPDGLRLTGRYNALFGADETRGSGVSRLIDEGIDRLVWNGGLEEDVS